MKPQLPNQYRGNLFDYVICAVVLSFFVGVVVLACVAER